jgi:hypothetical protein
MHRSSRAHRLHEVRIDVSIDHKINRIRGNRAVRRNGRLRRTDGSGVTLVSGARSSPALRTAPGYGRLRRHAVSGAALDASSVDSAGSVDSSPSPVLRAHGFLFRAAGRRGVRRRFLRLGRWRRRFGSFGVAVSSAMVFIGNSAATIKMQSTMLRNRFKCSPFIVFLPP